MLNPWGAGGKTARGRARGSRPLPMRACRPAGPIAKRLPRAWSCRFPERRFILLGAGLFLCAEANVYNTALVQDVRKATGREMKRVCVIDIAGADMALVRRDRELWVNSLPSAPRPMLATFPAVPASVQASLTTGVEPGVHGVVGGGLYRRESRTLSLDERSNTLLSRKRFWHSRHLPQRPKVAMVFWCNSLAGAADVALGTPTYGASSCELVGQPMELYAELAAAVGGYDPGLCHGPWASWAASAWIALAAEGIWRRHRPDLQWVHLPGVDFEAVRHGLGSPWVFEAMRVVDLLARRLADAVAAGGGETLVLSDGGYVPVGRAGLPNLRLRRAGLLKVVRTDGGEAIDLHNSRAFAMVDHQVAHLFCADASAAEDAAAALRDDPAVAAVAAREELFCQGAGRQRAGERIALAAGDAWFSYRWWSDEAEAPDVAFRADVQGKCGYDPCELFPGSGPGRIDPDPARVRASRGLVGPGAAGQCLLAATCGLPVDATVKATDVPEIVRGVMFG